MRWFSPTRNPAILAWWPYFKLPLIWEFWMYLPLFQAIEIEALSIQKWYRSMWETKSCFAGEEFESKWRLYKFPWLKPICFSEYLTGNCRNNIYVKQENTASVCWSRRPEVIEATSNVTCFFLIKFNCLLFKFLTVSYRNFFSRYLFVLTDFDSSRRHTHATTHAWRKQEIRAKVTSLDSIFFFRGNK